MTNKAPFCASLRPKRTVFTRLQIKFCPEGFHSFAFSTLNFNFPLRDTLHASRDTKILSTTVERSLQNNLFMQNKANFQKVKFNVNNVLTKDYDQLDTWSIRKTKPIQSQSKPIQSQLKPIQSQSKPIQSQLKPKKCQNKHNLSCVASGEAGTNPIYPVVASGEDGTNPTSRRFCERR
jgi:hypothetical protein